MNDLLNQIELVGEWLTSSAQWHGDDGIPHRLAEHLTYSGLSLLFATLIGLAFGLLVGHTGRGAFAVATVANLARAIPTFGLVVLVVTLAGLSTAPVLVALVALAVPPILINTFEGVRGVDPDTRDAAKGMGMTGWEVLLKVEVPMAMPLILLGLRVAAIQVVATATVAAYPGLGGLGRYIVDGLSRNDYQLVIGGSAVVVALALVVQAVFTALRRAVVSPGLRPVVAKS
ncbi:ABC transporter permease [Streptomyces tauricus]|uniref:ABC transporter permease n=1 Tax=Streptomyces tauricus TaxID=68274 RepID=A0ABZ1JD40_9ACTN|nr:MULTISPECIES: ABC transporter permease [Streptomyces]MCW8096885.1 ABC transporter permease [Streptomyces tauricus]UPZ27577.1 ABC transporter permease [Streptomyces sp. LRE541]GHA46100.1 ABC transporter permease [Streptomyces tauricus]